MMFSLRDCAGSARWAPALLTVLALLAIPGCWHEGRPIAKDILAHPAARFVVDSTRLTGLAANYDVDSILFKYRCSSPDAQTFWEKLQTQIENTGWTELDPHDSRQSSNKRLFERSRSGGSYWSIERVRIAYIPSAKTVVVACVQADMENETIRWEDDGEGRWSEYWWERFDSEVALCEPPH
jgi:hypothetical protein